MCKVLQFPKSTYYDKQHEKQPSALEVENKRLQADILTIYNESGKRYGAPKIQNELKEKGYSQISINRVQRHMRKLDIKSITVKKYRPHSKNKVYEEGENLLNRNFSNTHINQKWVCDITYIHVLRDGWCYLASVLDLHTKKIVGYSFSKTMDTEIVLTALNNAIKTQKPKAGLIIHSDRGAQYTSFSYQSKVKELEFLLSYSAKGCPYDNACIESFHAVLKKECVYLQKFIDYEHARSELFKYIEGFYNRKRKHSALGYKTPEQAEKISLAV